MTEKKSNKIKNTNTNLVGLTPFFTKVIILAVIAIGSYYYFHKVDLTEDKRYTLSEETIELLSTMDDVAEFKIYLEGDGLRQDL